MLVLQSVLQGRKSLKMFSISNISDQASSQVDADKHKTPVTQEMLDEISRVHPRFRTTEVVQNQA